MKFLNPYPAVLSSSKMLSTLDEDLSGGGRGTQGGGTGTGAARFSPGLLEGIK